MTVFDKIFLWLFMLGSPLYRKINVNISHLKAILTVKLTIDNRRPSTLYQMRSKQEKKELNNSTLSTMLSSLVIGALLLISFGIGADLTTRLTFFFSMFVFLLAATLISDFTSVLIDVKDNFIILPKPVNDPTFVLYRLLHIAIHISKLLLPMLSPAIVFFLFKGQIIVVVPFIFMSFMATLLVIFLVNAVYILILKITTPGKFQTIISYIQIGFAILIYAAYQLIPRLIDESVTKNLQISQVKYIRLFPPFWFAETCESFTTFSFGNMQFISLILSIVFPLLCMIVAVKCLAPSFTQKLSMINSSVAEIKNTDVETGKSHKVKSLWIEYLTRKFTTRGGESTGFLFTWKMMGRSRDFKIKVYPFFGYVFVIFILFILNNKSAVFSDIKEMSAKGRTFFIMLIYFSSLISISALGQIPFSEKFRASWIFHVTPLRMPGPLMTGALKSVIVCFVLPFFLVFALIGTPIIGLKVIPHLLLGCINAVAICSLLAYFNLRKLPFSNPPTAPGSGLTFTKTMLALILPFLFGYIHWSFFERLPALIIFSLIAIVIIRVSFSLIGKTQWIKISASPNQSN